MLDFDEKMFFAIIIGWSIASFILENLVTDKDFIGIFLVLSLFFYILFMFYKTNYLNNKTFNKSIVHKDKHWFIRFLENRWGAMLIIFIIVNCVFLYGKIFGLMFL